MCLISECVCCPVNKKKNCCNYPMISLMTAKEWLAVLSPPTVPSQQIILYIKYCKTHTNVAKRPDMNVTSCHNMRPVIAFV